MNAPATFNSAILDELAHAIGAEATVKLARAFGGIAIYVPAKLGHNHPITSAIGAEAAVRLADLYHGTEITIPRSVEIQDRQRRIRELARTGRLTKAAIALQTGVSERYVYQLLAEDDPAEEQLDLFAPRRKRT